MFCSAVFNWHKERLTLDVRSQVKHILHCVSVRSQTWRVGTQSNFSPLSIFNVDNQAIFPLSLEKTRYFPTLIRGDAWHSSSVPTTFGRDCLKEIWVEFPSEGNASDCHSVTIFRVNDVHFVSGNWTELFYFNLAWCRYSWNIIILQPPVAKQNLWLASSKMAFK